jgi:hypothetical protein
LRKDLSHIEGERLANLARTLLAPDEEFRWRPFHLAVLGEIIAALKDLGATVESLRPLGRDDTSTGPSSCRLAELPSKLDDRTDPPRREDSYLR